MKRVVFLAVVCSACGSTPALGDTRWQATWTHTVDDRHVVDGSSREPRSNVLELVRPSPAGTSLVARHRYDILDLPPVNGVAAATNGHVHRLSAGVRWSDERTRVRIEPTLAVSSNVGRHPKTLRASDVQPAAELEHRVAGAASDTALRVGIAADARLGRFVAYPTVRWGNDDTGRSHWQLGFPESRWRHPIGARASVELGVMPDGGQWQVRDRELTQRSRVRLALWRAAATLRWHFGERAVVAFVAGRSFEGELRHALVDGTRVRSGLPNATFSGVHAQVQW